MSLHFEDFEIGAIMRTRGRTITETDIVQFAGLSGDFIELHTNSEAAASSAFGQRIAHGALIFSISTGLMTQLGYFDDTVLAFYGLDRLRFTRPVFIGDTIHVLKTVESKEVKEEKGGGVVTFATQVLNQRGEPVIVYTDKLLMKARG